MIELLSRIYSQLDPSFICLLLTILRLLSRRIVLLMSQIIFLGGDAADWIVVIVLCLKADPVSTAMME